MTKTQYKFLLNFTLTLIMTACTPTRQIIYKPSTTPITIPTTIPNIPTTSTLPTVIPPSTSGKEMGSYSAGSLSGAYANSFALQSFIQSMVQRYGFSQSYLNGLFSQAMRLPSVIQLESPLTSNLITTGSGSWSRYRQQFLDEGHINNGVAFWRNNAAALEKASSTYGVDPEYIVAIIGVETSYGGFVGKTRTIDALTTLAFDTQKRPQYFSSELENFLLMSREEGYEPRAIVGSWAGAMGLGQFMPSSFRKLAVDFNGDGKRDLWQATDAIGSVANYFSKNGWQFHGSVAMPASQGFGFSTIELSTYSGSEYWTVYPNFDVIKKYNSSNFYAMAVHQLAQACKQRYR